MLHVNIHNSACYSSVISSMKILHVNIHNSACYSSVISSRKILHVNIHKFCISVIHQSSVPGKFCMLIFTNSAYQFQKNSAIYKEKKKLVLTSTVSIETVLVSACIFHVSAPKPVATNQLQVCYLEHYKDLENRCYH